MTLYVTHCDQPSFRKGMPPSCGNRSRRVRLYINCMKTETPRNSYGACIWDSTGFIGHSGFRKYLFRIGRQPSTECRHCSNSVYCIYNTVQHTLEVCPTFEKACCNLVAIVGVTSSYLSLSKQLAFCEDVILQKEVAEQEFKMLPSSVVEEREKTTYKTAS